MVFLGTLLCSIKEVKPPFLFDVEHGTALEAMQGNRASSRGEGGNLMVFSRFGVGTWGILSISDSNVLETLVFFQQRQDSCLVSRNTSRFSSSHGRVVGMPLELRRETQFPFQVATGILEFLSIIKRSQASSPLKHATPQSFADVKECEASCGDEAGN